MLLYEQPEILRKEKEKRSRTGFSEPSLRMISVPEASSKGCVWEPSMGIGAYCAVHCTNTHGEPSLSQRTCSPNRDGRGRIAGGLEISWRAQSCAVWCSDFQPSNLLFLTASHPLPLWCLQGVNGTKDNCVWLGIFNSWELYIQAHTRWTWLPPGTVSPPGPKRGCSDRDSKVTFTAEMPFKQRDRRRAQLWRNPAVETPSHLATQSQKTVCLKDWRLTIGRTVFVSC